MINEGLFGILLLLGAYLYDTLIGERPLQAHFAILSGNVISFFDHNTNKQKRKWMLVSLGALPIIVTTFMALVIGLSLHLILYENFFNYVGVAVSGCIGIYLLKTTFAIRSMGECVEPIIMSLKKGDIENARKYVSYIVSRPTENLDENEILSATFECVGESIVDGIISPLSYYLFFGLYGALIYRGINTADSMIGYRNSQYEHYGKVAARLDDVLNFIPTRIAVLATICAAFLMRLDVRQGLITMGKDGHVTESPNAGLTMSLYAGLFNVHVEKKGHYALGGDAPFPTIVSVENSIKLMKATAMFYIALCVAIIIVVPLPFVVV